MRATRHTLSAVGLVCATVGCSSSSDSGGRTPKSDGPEGGVIFTNPPQEAGVGVQPRQQPTDVLPAGFTKTDKGGMKLGEPLGDGSVPDAGPADGGVSRCGTTLLGVVRDFHPDMMNFEGVIADDRGLVDAQLGSDRKPVFVKKDPTATTSGSAALDAFYHSVPGTNSPYLLRFWLEPNTGVLTFHSNAFFPLDGAGFGNEGNPHNYHFTTEVHTAFQYRGKETFRFLGDDDLWVFINGKLAIDLGGVHTAEPAEVDLDARANDLGIEKGRVYPLDLFHAERHTTQSNFRLDTDLAFVDCGTIVSDVR